MKLTISAEADLVQPGLYYYEFSNEEFTIKMTQTNWNAVKERL